MIFWTPPCVGKYSPSICVSSITWELSENVFLVSLYPSCLAHIWHKTVTIFHKFLLVSRNRSFLKLKQVEDLLLWFRVTFWVKRQEVPPGLVRTENRRDSCGNSGNLSWMSSALRGQITTSFCCFLCFGPIFFPVPPLTSSLPVLNFGGEGKSGRETWHSLRRAGCSLRRGQEWGRHVSVGPFQCSF